VVGRAPERAGGGSDRRDKATGAGRHYEGSAAAMRLQSRQKSLNRV